MNEPDFNPFIDDEDEVEDVPVSTLPNFKIIETNPAYAPRKISLDPATLAEEMPPYESYDFEKEVSKIEEEMRSYEGRKGNSAATPQSLEAEASLPVEKTDELNLDDLELEEFVLDEAGPTELADAMVKVSEPEDKMEDSIDLDNLDLSDFDELELEPNFDPSSLDKEDPFSDFFDLLPEFDEAGNRLASKAEAEETSLGLSPPPAQETLELDEDGWGLLDANGSIESSVPQEQQEEEFSIDLKDDLDDWGFTDSELDFSTEELQDKAGESSETATSDEELDSLKDFEEFTPPEDPFAIPSDLEDESADLESSEDSSGKEKKPGKIKAKLADLKAQIKSELGVKDSKEDDKAAPDEEVERKTGTSGNFAKKIFAPYLFIVGFVMKGLKFLLGLLTGLPAIGKLFAKLEQANRALFVISCIIPLLGLVGGLYAHGNSKFQAQLGGESFPDGGSVKVVGADYTSEKDEASIAIENNGDVIAEIVPKVKLQATKLGLNPLKIFYPQLVAECVGDPVTVEIGETKTIAISCPQVDTLKVKASGEVAW